MVRLTIEVTGADKASKEVLRVADRFDQPLAPLLDLLAAEWTSTFKSHILEGGTPGITWPDLHPMTWKIRRHYGHTDSRKLIRRGDLLESITTLEVGPDSATIGTRNHAARIVQDGGTITQRGRTRQVPARPFIVVTEPLEKNTLQSIQDYFFGDPT